MAIVQETRVQRGSQMPFLVRPMSFADIPQMEEIEREAFPTVWPPTSFPREMDNRLARYLVVCDVVEAAPNPVESPPPALERKNDGLLRRLWPFGRPPEAEAARPHAPSAFVAGFAGTWFMVDEAHLVAIAVRESHKRRGLGELLLVATIEMAMQRAAREVTLEVRASNRPAQLLYEKYGFHTMGVRKGYYSDNHEDAVIMTTDPIWSAAYQTEFQRLRDAFIRRRGETTRTLN